MLRVEAGDIQFVRDFLHSHPAAIHEKTRSGNCAVRIAIRKNDIKMLTLLLRSSPHINTQNNTLLFTAVFHDFREISTTLLVAGADQTIADSNGWSPLMVAARKGHLSTFQLLLQHIQSRDARKMQLLRLTHRNETLFDLAPHNLRDVVVRMAISHLNPSSPSFHKDVSDILDILPCEMAHLHQYSKQFISGEHPLQQLGNPLKESSRYVPQQLPPTVKTSASPPPRRECSPTPILISRRKSAVTAAREEFSSQSSNQTINQGKPFTGTRTRHSSYGEIHQRTIEAADQRTTINRSHGTVTPATFKQKPAAVSAAATASKAAAPSQRSNSAKDVQNLLRQRSSTNMNSYSSLKTVSVSPEYSRNSQAVANRPLAATAANRSRNSVTSQSPDVNKDDSQDLQGKYLSVKSLVKSSQTFLPSSSESVSQTNQRNTSSKKQIRDVVKLPPSSASDWSYLEERFFRKSSLSISMLCAAELLQQGPLRNLSMEQVERHEIITFIEELVHNQRLSAEQKIAVFRQYKENLMRANKLEEDGEADLCFANRNINHLRPSHTKKKLVSFKQQTQSQQNEEHVQPKKDLPQKHTEQSRYQQPSLTMILPVRRASKINSNNASESNIMLSSTTGEEDGRQVKTSMSTPQQELASSDHHQSYYRRGSENPLETLVANTGSHTITSSNSPSSHQAVGERRRSQLRVISTKLEFQDDVREVNRTSHFTVSGSEKRQRMQVTAIKSQPHTQQIQTNSNDNPTRSLLSSVSEQASQRRDFSRRISSVFESSKWKQQQQTVVRGGTTTSECTPVRFMRRRDSSTEQLISSCEGLSALLISPERSISPSPQ